MTTILATRRTRITALAAALAIAVLTAVLIWQPWNDDRTPPLVAAADYSGRPSACLAAGDDPQIQPAVQKAWRSMQDAAKGQAVNVQQLTVPAATREQAGPYLAGLVAQHCTLIVTVGPAASSAVPDLLGPAAGTRFIAIDAGTDLHEPRITQLAGDTAPAKLADQIRALTPHQ